VINGVKHEVTNEVTNEVTREVINEMTNEVTREVTNEETNGVTRVEGTPGHQSHKEINKFPCVFHKTVIISNMMIF